MSNRTPNLSGVSEGADVIVMSIGVGADKGSGEGGPSPERQQVFETLGLLKIGVGTDSPLLKGLPPRLMGALHTARCPREALQLLATYTPQPGQEEQIERLNTVIREAIG